MTRRYSSAALTSVLLVCPSLLFAQDPEISVTATHDLVGAAHKSISLSESLFVTLRVEGPAPLRVELPKQLLVVESDRDWKIRAAGAPSVAPLGKDRQQWTQKFRLDPYVYGNAMTVVFAPIRVNNREVAAPGFVIAVEDPQLPLDPNKSSGVTGIETLPPTPRPPSSPVWWWPAIFIVAIAIAALAWWMRRSPAPIPPRQWAMAAFERLELEASPPAVVVNGIAAVVRGFIERQFGIPAPKLTTEELLVAAQQAPWPAEQTDALRGLLGDLDRVKFAGDIPDDAERGSLLVRSREWVNSICPEPKPG
jgi:hypothetical protein